MTIALAQHRDLGQIWLLREQTSQWLATKGTDQWSDAGLDRGSFLRRVQGSIEAAETWVWLENGEILGTISIDHWADKGLWTQAQLDDSVVIHRMIVSRAAAGRGIGTALLDWAEIIAAYRDCSWMRLDAWTTNQALHRYYQSQGFRHVRTSIDHGTPSGALFERRVAAQVMESRSQLAAEESGLTTVYTVPQVRVWQRHRQREASAMVVPGCTYEVAYSAGHWYWGDQLVVSYSAYLDSLDPAVTYRAAHYGVGGMDAVVVSRPRRADVRA